MELCKEVDFQLVKEAKIKYNIRQKQSKKKKKKKKKKRRRLEISIWLLGKNIIKIIQIKTFLFLVCFCFALQLLHEKKKKKKKKKKQNKLTASSSSNVSTESSSFNSPISRAPAAFRRTAPFLESAFVATFFAFLATALAPARPAEAQPEATMPMVGEVSFSWRMRSRVTERRGSTVKRPAPEFVIAK